MAVTMEDLDNTVQQIKAVADKMRDIMYPHGKPDYMTEEHWAEITGEES